MKRYEYNAEQSGNGITAHTITRDGSWVKYYDVEPLFSAAKELVSMWKETNADRIELAKTEIELMRAVEHLEYDGVDGSLL